MKQYKSNEELIDYLITKNVIINDKEEALNKIEKYSYYSIVNTYKEVFKDSNGNYLDNVTFDEIFSLFEFDKNLKSIFMKYALEIEIIIKSLIANQIAEVYGIEKYLDKNCFDSNATEENIDKFISRVNNEINDNYGRHPAITHYKNTYGFIPPFVVVKVITIGQISRYYGLLKQEDRQKIAKYFKLSDKILKQILINLTMVRNISAHADRLYTFHSKFFISFKSIDKNYKLNDNLTNLYMIMKCMGKLLDKDKYKEFENLVSNEINILEEKLNSIKISNILNIMGFPVNK